MLPASIVQFYTAAFVKDVCFQFLVDEVVTFLDVLNISGEAEYSCVICVIQPSHFFGQMQVIMWIFDS